MGNDILIKVLLGNQYKYIKQKDHCLWGKKKTKSEIMQMNLNGFAYIKYTSNGLSGKSDMAISYLFVCVFLNEKNT